MGFELRRRCGGLDGLAVACSARPRAPGSNRVVDRTGPPPADVGAVGGGRCAGPPSAAIVAVLASRAGSGRARRRRALRRRRRGVAPRGRRRERLSRRGRGASARRPACERSGADCAGGGRRRRGGRRCRRRRPRRARPRPRRPCPSRWRGGRRASAAATLQRPARPAAARPRRRAAAELAQNAGNGQEARRPSSRPARARSDGRTGSRSSPAASASRRQRLAVREVAGEPARVARAQAACSPAATMIPWMRRQRAPETMSSYSSARRRRARKSVDSTAGRLMPIRSPISLVGEALELAQDEDLVVGLRQAAERAAQVVEVLLGGDRRVRRRAGADELGVVGGREPVVGVVGDLLGALGAAERVDAAVLGDLVEPGLERERLLGLAHAAQRGDEDLLRHVLRAAVVLDHAEHVGVDAALVALVEDLEGAVVAAAHRGDEALVGVRGLVRHSIVCRRQGGAAHSPTHVRRSLSR